MKYLVISHKHGLLPLGWRLQKAGYDTQVCVWNSRYEAAWEGRLVKSPIGTPAAKREGLAPLIDQALLGELVVLTDNLKAQEMFQGAPYLFGVAPGVPWPKPPAVCLLGWFDGAQFLGSHWFVPDWGLWPGGLGAQVMGGGLLVVSTNTPTHPKMLDSIATPLAAVGFKGLVLMGLDYLEAAHELVPMGFIAGWPWLAMHAWLEQLADLGGFLANGPYVFQGKQFVSVLPVTQPPWPVRGAPGPAQVKLEGLTPGVTRQCFFHDIQVVGTDVQTAGLDGLVAVVAHGGATPESARMRALQVAAALPLPEKQMRVDVGVSSTVMLTALEQLGWL